jgi:hypothetical protein
MPYQGGLETSVAQFTCWLTKLSLGLQLACQGAVAPPTPAPFMTVCAAGQQQFSKAASQKQFSPEPMRAARLYMALYLFPGVN